MDINLLRSLVMIAAFAAFVGIVWWAYAPARKLRFERDALLPFSEDDPRAEQVPSAWPMDATPKRTMVGR